MFLSLIYTVCVQTWRGGFTQSGWVPVAGKFISYTPLPTCLGFVSFVYEYFKQASVYWIQAVVTGMPKETFIHFLCVLVFLLWLFGICMYVTI